MNSYGKIMLRSIAALFTVAMLFSCESRINKVRQLDREEYGPVSIQKNVDLVYTDSGKVKAILRSPKLIDYSNLKFPYREFPEGASAEIYNEKGEKSEIYADYAIAYENTNLLDLRGNVKVIMPDSTLFMGRQLYWDQTRSWVFTDKENTIVMSNGTRNHGQGFDSDENFNNFTSRTNSGTHYVKDKNQ